MFRTGVNPIKSIDSYLGFKLFEPLFARTSDYEWAVWERKKAY